MAIPERTLREVEAGLPETVWVGRKDHEWVLYAFENEKAAQRWQAEDDSVPGKTGRVRRVWEVPTADAVERIVIVVPQTTFWAGQGTP